MFLHTPSNSIWTLSLQEHQSFAFDPLSHSCFLGFFLKRSPLLAHQPSSRLSPPQLHRRRRSSRLGFVAARPSSPSHQQPVLGVSFVLKVPYNSILQFNSKLGVSNLQWTPDDYDIVVKPIEGLVVLVTVSWLVKM
ncbi:hypothetical protein ABKV19_001730 [Rosa sericea]